MTNPLRERRSVSISNFGKGLTEQSHKKSTSMNFILDKYKKTGVLEHVNAQTARYDQMPNSIDLHQAMNIIAEANSSFESLPSSIRKNFDNDPGQFLDFVQNENNYQQIKDMGLSVEHLPEPIIETPVEQPVNDPGAPTPESTP